MRKIILPVLLSSWSLLSFCADNPPPPAPAQPAPLAQKSDSKSQAASFKPEIKGSEIISGNKKLSVSKNGEITVSADGKVLTKGYLSFHTETPDRRAKDYFRPGDKKWTKSELRAENGKFIWEGEFSDFGLTGNCRQTVELLDSGLVKVDTDSSFTETPELKIRLSCFWFEFDYGGTLGKKLRFDGKDYIVPEKQGDKLSHWDFMALSKPRSAIEFFYDNPGESFAVIPEEGCLWTRFYYTDWSKIYNFRIFPNTGSNSLSFQIDIRKALDAGASEKTLAGIDFKAVEDLDMPDFKSSKNLFPNPSFEQGAEYLRISDGREGRVADEKIWGDIYSVDSTAAKFGKSSLRINTIHKERTGDHRGLVKPGNVTSLPTPVDPGKYTFSFYVKGDRPGKQTLSVWSPNACWTGNTYVALPGANKIFPVSGDWTRQSMTFDVPASMPVLFNFNAVSETGDGNVWMDGVQFEKGGKATDFETRAAEGRLLTSKEDNFLQPSDKIDAKLEISAKPDASGKVKVSVINFFGETVFSGTLDFKCGSDGKAVVSLPFDGKFQRGIFIVKAEYELADGSKTYDFHRFSIMDFLENKHRLKNIFAENYGDSDEQRHDFFKLLDRYRKVGLGAKNHTMRWEKIIWDKYREYGIDVTDSFMFSYTWNKKTVKMDGFAISSTPVGNRMPPDYPGILVRDYHAEAGGEITDAWLEKFKNAAAKVAKDNPWITMWAAGGEVFAKFPASWWSKDGTPEKASENFAKILKAFYQGVKEGNPNAKVFQDDPCNMSPEGGIAETGRLLAEINKLGGVKFDMIGIHPYRHRPENPDLDADAQTLFKTLAENNYGDVPVFWPEGMHYGPYNIPQWGVETATWGPPKTWYYGALSYDMGWTEKITAAWRARSWLVALKYQDKVKSFMSAAFQNNFEMDLNLTPFATQKISNTLGRLLGDAYFKKDVRFAPYVRCYIFEDEKKRPVAAVWCCHPKLDAGVMASPEAEANFAGSLDQIFDLMESERSFKPGANGVLKFPVSSFPLFFRGRPGTLDKFIQAFDNASLISGEGISPLMMSAKPVSPEKVEISAKNYLSREFKGSIDCAGSALPLTVPPSGGAAAQCPLPAPLKADTVTKESLPLMIKSGEKTFGADVSFDGFLCKKAAGEIKIDGNLDDWKDIPAVKLTNRYIADRNIRKVEDNDFSGWFKIAWSEKGIYICAKITDDKFVHEAFTLTGNRWSNDCLQIYFDSLCDARLRQQRGYDENDYDYAVFPNPDGKSSIVWRYRTPDPQLGLATQAPKDNTIADDIPSAFKQTEDGYIYEVFFPAKYLLPIRLEKGCAIGFGLYAADCDNPDAKYSKQEIRVKSALTLSPSGTGCYNNPHLWPAMLLWE